MIEVKNLTKLYGGHTAVSNLNFTVQTGKICGFLGPNGAGKTTTMNIMTGCLAATEGQVLINGYDIYEDSVKAKRLIGYLPEIPPLYPDMTPFEYLKFVAKAKDVEKSDIEHQLDHVMKITGIHSVRDRLIKNLSKGYKQRVGIAQALLGNPEIIILDEPTVGLDPRQIIEIRELIKELGKKHTVLLSSHILSEVNEICDNIMILSHGKLVANDTSENLEKSFVGSLTIEISVKASDEEIYSALGSICPDRNGITVKSRNGAIAEVSVASPDGSDISEQIFLAFANIKKPILKMSTAKASLEDVFLDLTGSKKEMSEKKARHKLFSDTGEEDTNDDDSSEDNDENDDESGADDGGKLKGGKI